MLRIDHEKQKLKECMHVREEDMPRAWRGKSCALITSYVTDERNGRKRNVVSGCAAPQS